MAKSELYDLDNLEKELNNCIAKYENHRNYLVKVNKKIEKKKKETEQLERECREKEFEVLMDLCLPLENQINRENITNANDLIKEVKSLFQTKYDLDKIETSLSKALSDKAVLCDKLAVLKDQISSLKKNSDSVRQDLDKENYNDQLVLCNILKIEPKSTRGKKFFVLIQDDKNLKKFVELKEGSQDSVEEAWERLFKGVEI